MGQCGSLDVNSGVSVEAFIGQKVAWFRKGTEMWAQGYFVVLNKGGTKYGARRYRNVGSGAFVVVLLKGTSNLVQCSQCDSDWECFLRGLTNGGKHPRSESWKELWPRIVCRWFDMARTSQRVRQKLSSFGPNLEPG